MLGCVHFAIINQRPPLFVYSHGAVCPTGLTFASSSLPSELEGGQQRVDPVELAGCGWWWALEVATTVHLLLCILKIPTMKR